MTAHSSGSYGPDRTTLARLGWTLDVHVTPSGWAWHVRCPDGAEVAQGGHVDRTAATRDGCAALRALVEAA